MAQQTKSKTEQAPPQAEQAPPQAEPQPVYVIPPEASGGVTFARGVKIAGEAFLVPGSSLIIDGRVGAGAAHAVGGLVATWAFGPLGWLVAAANSYAQSVTHQHIHQHFQQPQQPTYYYAAQPQPAAQTQPA